MVFLLGTQKKHFLISAFTWSILGFFLATGLASANTEVAISSIYDGNSPYLVVLQDSTGPSKRDPGIYIPDATGNLTALIKGHVLNGGAAKGIIQQFSITKENRRYPAITVVDGKLYLFELGGTDASTKPMIAEIGGEEHPLLDVNGSLVTLPPITNISDVQVTSLDPTRERQVLAVSVRSPGMSVIGNGITFVAALNSGIDQPADAPIFYAPPVVIDYKFQNYTDLTALFVNANEREKPQIFSRLVLQSMLPRRGKSEPQPMKEWRDKIRQVLLALDRGELIDRNPEIPVFDILGETPLLAVYPNLPINIDPAAGAAIYQIYDPVSGQDGIVFDQDPATITSLSSINLRGRVNLRPDGFPLFYSNATSPNTSLVYENNELYLILSQNITGKAAYPLKLSGGEEEELPENVSYFVQEVFSDAEKKDLHNLYVFVSSKKGGTKRTKSYIVIKKEGTFDVQHALTVSNDFYMQDELQARIPTETHSEDILFDNLTPPQANAAIYGQVARNTHPYLNITQTVDPNRPIQNYIASVAEKEISGRKILFQQFDPTEAVRNQTGIYVFRPDGTIANKVTGELLENEGRTTFGGVIVGKRQRFKAAQGEDPLDANLLVMAVDAGFAGGNSGFTLVPILTFTDEKSSIPIPDPAFLQQKMPFPFARFKGAQLLAGADRHKNSFILLVAVSEKDKAAAANTDSTEPGIYAFTFQAQVSRDQTGSKAVLLGRKMEKLSSEILEISDVLGRVRYDKEGQPYWVQTPAKADSAEDYGVVPLLGSNLVTIKPNNLGRNSVKWASDQQNRIALGLEKGSNSDDSYGYGFGDDWGKSWEIGGAYSMERVFGKLKTEAADQEAINSYFSRLGAQLESVVEGTPSSTIFVVPEKLKKQFMMALRVHMESEEGQPTKMNFRNRDLWFYYLDPQRATSQSMVLQQLKRIREKTGKNKPVLMADAAVIIAVDRPKDEIEDTKVLIRNLDPNGKGEPVLPHIMYLLATDGRSVPLEQFEAGSIPETNVAKIIVATPEELTQIELQAKLEAKHGIMKAYSVNTDFLWTPWRVLSPESSMASPEIKKAKEQPVSELERDVFPNLIDQLEAMSDPNRPPQHEVLLVPEELKPLALKLILSRWSSGRGGAGAWDYRNPNLIFFRVNQGIPVTTQKEILENVAVMRNFEKDRRAFMLGELSDVRRMGRIVNEQEKSRFVISDWAESDSSSLIGGSDEEKKPQQPHALYMLEAEGRTIQPQQFVAENTNPDRRASMLLVGTPQEWQAIQREVSGFEERFHVMERFHVNELAAPTLEKRRALIERVATTSQIRSLNYRYDAGGLGKSGGGNAAASEAESMQKLIGYIVNRSETLAKETKQEITSAFIRVLTEFSRALVEDNYLRVSGVIDRAFAERLLSRVFSIPMNLNTLAPDDPLVRLAREDAPLVLQAHGYEGPLELKAAVIRTILAQTRMDPVKTIPSSIFVYGDTSSGKTVLFRTLIKMMGLKEYDFANPNDENAGAIIINVGRLTKDHNPADAELMSVKTALAHVSHFLTLPRGYRGLILFDDEHKADEEVVQQVITFQQALFEAPGGMFKAKSLGAMGGTPGEIREVPVRNIILGATINPTQDQEKIRRFKNTGDDTEMIMATLSGSNFMVEKSFFARWGMLLNLSKFPVEAKAPKLQQSLRTIGRNDFNVKGRLTLVSPQAVQSVVRQFPDANAREFLSVATSTLLNITERGGRDSLFVVVPSNRGAIASRHSWEASGTANAGIEEGIRRTTAAVPVESRIEGKLQFLSILVDALRTDLYESLVASISQDPIYAGGPRQLRSLLAPFLHAVVANFTTKGFLSLSTLNLDPFDFEAQTPIQRQEFRRVLEQMVQGEPRYFPIKFYDEFSRDGIEQSLTDSNYRSAEGKNRAQVLSKFAGRIHNVLSPYAAEMIRVQSLDQLPDSNTWFKSLKEADPTEASKLLGKQLGELFLDFMEEIHARDLTEVREGTFETITTYDAVRLFMITVDRAISKLPWGRINHFLVQNLSRAATDMDLGQLPGVQYLLFNSKFSMVKSPTHELVMQMAMSSQSFKDWTEEDKVRFTTNFSKNCERMLLQPHVNAPQPLE